MKRLALKLLHPIRRLYWKIAKPKTFGVKVAIYSPNEQEVILVRHRYGSSALMLPGGALEKGETIEQAAEREILEELNIKISNLRHLHTYVSEGEGKRDTVYLFSATSEQIPNPNPSEIDTATFVSVNELPRTVSPATRRRLKEIQSNAYSETW
jgi:8-oxo-dGTP pyrophosphatase MutT (NUDIX family)